ncbi:MAG: kynureninase [Bacteroidota bacterium]
MITQVHCRTLDQQDPLAHLQDAFHLPKGKINMDGNSLGSLPKTTLEKLTGVVNREWREGMIASWSEAGWFDSPIRVGNKIAPLIGANTGEVLVADTTSINIYKALCAALHLNKSRHVMLSEAGNFPTDLYMMQGISTFSDGKLQAKVVEPEAIFDALDESIAVLLLTQVHYKTAAIKDMKAITQRAHEKGILVIWDLSHSVGSIEVQLNDCEVDFAVGCGYKFLNGGPGAPAFIYVAERHQQEALVILAGWMGHQDPFAFTEDYQPAPSIARFRCGTPGILGMAALENGVDLFAKTDLKALRTKALQLSRLFIQLMEQECANFGFTLASPKDDNRRAGHVAYRHEQGHGIYQAIKKRGIISDFRTPDILRFGITPMYLRFQDIFQVVQVIKEVMATEAWDNPAYQIRAAIT